MGLNVKFIEQTPVSFCLSSIFPVTNFTEKTVGFSRIRTRIVGAEGEHVPLDHHHGPG